MDSVRNEERAAASSERVGLELEAQQKHQAVIVKALPPRVPRPLTRLADAGASWLS